MVRILHHRNPEGLERAWRRSSLELLSNNPRAFQSVLDAAMPGPDDIGGNGADKGIKCLRTDRVHYAFADFLRIETCGGEALGQHRFLIGTDLRAAHVVRAVTGAARDIRVDRTRT